MDKVFMYKSPLYSLIEFSNIFDLILSKHLDE